ncbi:MAG TPA: ABC transporter permease [Solirubrobacteraceae bacterium]|jgi:ABC-2 type transport system permease protein
MSAGGLAVHQSRYDLKQFLREPASVFFTAILPLIFLVLFVAIFGNNRTEINGNLIQTSTYYLPAILALSIVNATFVNLAIWVTITRDRGQLKRLRATPIPPWAIVTGRAYSALVVAAAMTVLVCGAGVLFYGVSLPSNALPGALITLFVGTLSFSALGFAAAALIPSENAAPPIANAICLPLEFISGIFVPADQIPKWMLDIAAVFPIKPFFDAMLHTFDPHTTGAGIMPGKLAVLVAWGVVGAIVALRFFRWSPKR